MFLKKNDKTIVVMPAYNAAKTLERTHRDISKEVVAEIILGDDCSSDNTIEIAKRLGIKVLKTPQNLGYGGNQKMLYEEALKDGAEVIIMIHPDWQYDATKIPELIAPILRGEKDVMLGSRILGGRLGTLAGGMPIYKFISNRFLTLCENLTFKLGLSEYHTGMRAYNRKVIETIPYKKNSNNFVFDTQFLAEVAAAGFRVGEIPIPCRYFKEASSVNFINSAIYGLQTLEVCLRYLFDKSFFKA